MMDWNIDFITREQFEVHVLHTVEQYGCKLFPYNLERFNKNIIDPVKMVFDKAVYGKSWKELIDSEIFRQRDKSNANDIGYFHQRIFQYIDGCRVPDNGKEGGWDVIVEIPEGYSVDDRNIVHRICVEMKNKHNTMNSASASRTYIKMQNQLLKDDDCACMLVEAIAAKSQNAPWTTTVDGHKVSHARIRRVSLDRFYEIATGQSDAFYKICLALPDAIEEVMKNNGRFTKPHDTVMEELIASTNDNNVLMAMYMLGFRTYIGFN